MGKLVVTEFVSLDGVMEAPGGEDFKYPGWSFAFDRGEDGNQIQARRDAGDRSPVDRTRDVRELRRRVAEREGEFADKFNAMPKYVVSSTLEDPGGPTPQSSRATSSTRPRS